MIGLDKINLIKINNYNETEFYPKGWTLASGCFNWTNSAGEEFTISMSVMKINDTQFTAMGPKCKGCSNISGAEECREIYNTDNEMLEEYYEDLSPEYVCVTLAYDSNVLDYRTISFIYDDLDGLDDISIGEDFNKALEGYVDALLNTDAGKHWLNI